MGIVDNDQGSQGPQGPHPLITGMSALHDMTKAKYDKLAEAKKMLGKVKNELLPLVKMGETVNQDDVIKAAGKLVSHGLGAGAVAGLLADMPPDGQALAAWIAQHMIGIQQREQQLTPILTATQHALGTHALQLLAAHSIHGSLPSETGGLATDAGPGEISASPAAEGGGTAASAALAPAAGGGASPGNELGASGPPGGLPNAG